MAQSIKLRLSMKKKGSGDSVYHKQDGQRFGHTNTVKLNVNTDYVVRLTFRPAMDLQSVIIGGDKREFRIERSGADEVEESKIYLVDFDTTGYDLHKKGTRKDVQFNLEFYGGLYMKFSLQCKMYKEGEQNHSLWGSVFNHIDFDCYAEEGRTFVEVIKEKYL